MQLLPGSGRCWPHVPQAEGPSEHRGPPEHPEGLATGCLSARSQGCTGRRGGDAVRCPGPGRSPSRPHRPLRIRRVFLSPMKNLQRHGPVRSLGESPRPSSASPCPHFSRTFQPWWPDPLGAGETLFLEVPPLPSPPGPELPAPRPPSRRLSGDAEGADGGTVGPPAPCTARGKRSRPRARPGGARGGPRSRPSTAVGAPQHPCGDPPPHASALPPPGLGAGCKRSQGPSRVCSVCSSGTQAGSPVMSLPPNGACTGRAVGQTKSPDVAGPCRPLSPVGRCRPL